MAFLEDGSGLWKVLGGDRIPSEKDAVCRKSGERKLAWRGGALGHGESISDGTGGQGGWWDVEGGERGPGPELGTKAGWVLSSGSVLSLKPSCFGEEV